MKQLKVELGDRSYPIYIGENLLQSQQLADIAAPYSRVMVLTNTTVEPLYMDTLGKGLAGIEHSVHVMEDGESEKNLEVLNGIITGLLENRFARDACLLALGGGVVGDITGFAAACYQRGIDFIQVPTTLLAQVDSSVGGKTAVNHALGKNMIGAFHQPVAVFADTLTLETLPDRELAAGLAEVIKYGLIRDADFFSWLEDNIGKLTKRDTTSMQYAIERSCVNKSEVVSADEKEKGMRALLNLGHTFGHAIETALNYETWLHGEAVALGTLMAADLSHRLGWLEAGALTRIANIYEQAGLPLQLPASLANIDMEDLMMVDKKVKGGKLVLVLLKDIGDAVTTDDFDPALLAETIAHFQANTGPG